MDKDNKKEQCQEAKKPYKAPDFTIVDLNDSIGRVGGSGIGGGGDVFT